MSEEKLGQHYLAALNEAFPGVVLDHAWQTKDQLTVTVKVNYLPEVVEFLYYKQDIRTTKQTIQPAPYLL